MKLISITSLKETAKSRPIGYLEDVLAHGKVEGDFLMIEWNDYLELVQKYNPPKVKTLSKIPIQKPCCGQKPSKGLGDIVAKIAQPIAKVLDRTMGTHIQGCSKCKQRQEKLNAWMPFTGSK